MLLQFANWYPLLLLVTRKWARVAHEPTVVTVQLATFIVVGCPTVWPTDRPTDQTQQPVVLLLLLLKQRRSWLDFHLRLMDSNRTQMPIDSNCRRWPIEFIQLVGFWLRKWESCIDVASALWRRRQRRTIAFVLAVLAVRRALQHWPTCCRTNTANDFCRSQFRFQPAR